MVEHYQPFHLVPGITIQRNDKPKPGANSCMLPNIKLLVEEVWDDLAQVMYTDDSPGTLHTYILRSDITEEWFIPD